MNNDHAQGTPRRRADGSYRAVAATAELVSRGFAEQDARRMLASARRMTPPGTACWLARTENIAVTYLGKGRYCIDLTPRRVNLADRFSLDEEKAREWLGRIVAAYPNEAEDISEQAPTISAGWHARSDGAERTAERLVRGAVEDGILICPDGMDVYFVYELDSDGGSYHFAVDIGHEVTTQVSLATWGYEMRKLGDPDATGIEAALSILEEAEAFSNKALANLVLLLAAQGTGHPTARPPGSAAPSSAGRGDEQS
jgi:hypothetical protein